MMVSKRVAAGVALMLLAMSSQAADVNVDAFAKRDSFEHVKISPTGEYYAATVPLEDRVALVIMSRSDKKLLGTFSLGRNSAIDSFDWVSPDLVLIGVAEKIGALDRPQPTGELFALNTNGGNEMLIGQRLADNSLGTHLQTKKAEDVAAFLVDDLPDDDKNVLISVSPLARDPYTRLERMDAYTGKRTVVTRAPVRNASFYTDNKGVARFVAGSDIRDNSSKLYYRADDKSPWTLINDEAATQHVEYPVGFSADDHIAYLQVEQDVGPDAIVAYHIADGKRTEVLRDKDMDPATILYRPGTRIPVGATFEDGKSRLAFFDDASADAKLLRSLQAAFGDNAATITSTTRDGRLNLVSAWSDRNPGDFYLFDSVAKKAEYVISRADWFDPDKMASQSPIAFKARDGLAIRGFLTVPNGASGRNMPLVVMPHGGPFFVSDQWGFDEQAQMLAAAGYAVLQVNFRGSNNRGRKFEQAGAQQWGLAMQDDVTDATKWAVQQGVADPRRICIYGASYGAYAALMGAVREPTLYRCAAGYVGVYDLPQMYSEGVSKRGSLGTFMRQWVGEDTKVLAANSPTQQAARIKIPVLLAAGREDKTAPVQHTERMERALRGAGAAVEASYYAGEGHGFYKPENRRDFYSKLLGFLSRNLGGGTAGVSASATP